MKTPIALKYRNAIVADPEAPSTHIGGNPTAQTLVCNMMTLGFIPTEGLLNYLNVLSADSLVTIAEELIPELQHRKGADVVYNPMYPNFPQQVMEMSHCELFFNAIIHYWSGGHWKPQYNKLPREFAFENVSFKSIGVIDEPEFLNIFTQLLSSNESLSEGDKKAIAWLFDKSGLSYTFEGDVPFKENLCYLAATLLKKDGDISMFIRTATDLLRVCTALSGGDISLAGNTKFVSFPRKLRRHFVDILNKVINREDIDRHQGKWIRLFHSLHIGEYPGPAATIANEARRGDKFFTFTREVQKHVNTGDYAMACELLKNRPGEFARRLDHMVRLAGMGYGRVLNEFFSVVNNVPTRILLAILGNLKVRDYYRERRIVFPKGAITSATVLRQEIPALDKDTVGDMWGGIEAALFARFSKLEPLGKTWIAPELLDCPLPTAQRSASEGSISVARGTRLPFGDDKKTLRFFIYWVGQDIDLSATMHDENFAMIKHISYTNLKSEGFQACHSGDITRAPDGACEFIDVTIDGALAKGARYVAMNVLVYNGPTFAEHDKVYAGWMTRTKPMSNEVFDAKTVEQKLDLTSSSKNCIPVLFDLKERTAIWTDLTTPSRISWGGNNIESNRASITETLEAMVTLDNKFSLAELFAIHANARGELVNKREDAETIFSMDEGTTPYDIAVINSEFIK